MKRSFFIFSAFCSLFFAFLLSCPLPGSLEVKIQADKTVCDSGDVVKFQVLLPRGNRLVSGKAKILNELGEQVAAFVLDETLSFEYKFVLSGEYQVLVATGSNRDYGYAQVGISVIYKGWVPDWSLADSGNKTSLMGKEGDPQSSYDFKLGYFFEPAQQEKIDHIDVFIYNQKRRVASAVKLDSDIFKYTYREAHGLGAVDFIVHVYFKDGNGVQVRDKLILLDPNNPVEILFNASKNNKNYPDAVFVKGTIAIVNLPGEVQDVSIKRICYYGKEEGVYPLAEPVGDPNNASDTTFYSKVGSPIVAHEEEYVALKEGVVVDSPLKWDADEGSFTFLDPMPYYNEKGEVETLGFTWDYAKFDREAWKYIKRKKNFDLKKAVSVEYVVTARAVVDGTLKSPVVSSVESGHPYLSTLPMTQFCLWTKETTMNRLWHMQVPRYCFNKTMSWLRTDQSVNGNYSGKVSYSVSGLSGSGGVYNYSDWPCIKVASNKDLYVSVTLKTNQRQDHYLDLVITPDSSLWERMQFVINNLGVRDYILQWGVWVEGGITGKLELTRGTQEKEVLEGDQLRFMPTYSASAWKPFSGYGYDEFDWTGAEHVEKNAATWTKINFRYAPTLGDPPEFGEWVNHPVDWVCKYVVE